MDGVGVAESNEPAAGRRERKRRRMASHLAATAFDLFEEHGFEAVTMEQVAAEADVAKATLYHYFPMKEALLAYRFRDEIVEGMEALAASLSAHRNFASRMRFLLRESAAWHVSRRAYMPHYLRYLQDKSGAGNAKPDANTASGATWNILTDMFHAAQRDGDVRDTVPAEKLAWSLEFLLYGAVTAWLLEPDADLAAEFDLVFRLWMDGVATRPGPRSRAGRRKVAAKSR